MAFPGTYLSIRNAVIAKLRLDATNDVTKVNDWIQQAYADVAQETRCFQQSATSTLTSGTATYTLSSSVVHIEFLTVTPVGSTPGDPLQEVGLYEIRRLRRLNNVASGPSTHYSLSGLNQLDLWPTPSGADTLTTDYSHLPTALSADGDVPAIPEPFGSKLLEYGACTQAAEFKKDLLMLSDFQQSYQGWIRAFQRYLNRRQGAYPRSFPVFGDNVYVPHDPSTDAVAVR